jgi:aconitase B
MAYASKIDSMAPEIYKYLNFDKMDERYRGIEDIDAPS